MFQRGETQTQEETAKAPKYVFCSIDNKNFIQTKLFTNLFHDRYHFENNGTAFGDGTLTYTFYCKNPLKSGEQIKVLDSIVIPGVLEQEDMNFGTDGFTLTIKAEAVQVDNLNAQDAYEAFIKIVGWEVGTEYGA